MKKELFIFQLGRLLRGQGEGVKVVIGNRQQLTIKTLSANTEITLFTRPDMESNFIYFV